MMENTYVGQAFEDLSLEDMSLSQGVVGSEARISSTPVCASIVSFSVWSSAGCAVGGAVSVAGGITFSVGATR